MMTLQERRYYFGVIVKKIAEYERWDMETTHNFLKMEYFMECDTLVDLAAKLIGNEITTTGFLKSLSTLINKATTTKDLPPSYYEDKFRKIRMDYSPLIFIPQPNEYGNY